MLGWEGEKPGRYPNLKLWPTAVLSAEPCWSSLV